MQRGFCRDYLSSENMICHKNAVWFTELDNNNLYFYDISTEKCTCFCTFSEEHEKGKRLFGTMAVQDDYLYLFPFSAEKIYKIHMQTGQITGWRTEGVDEGGYGNYCPKAKFFSAHRLGNKIFVMPASYPAIIECQTENGNMQYHRDWIPEILSFVQAEYDNAWFRKTIAVGNKIYAPLCKGNAVLVFDMSTSQYEIFKVGDDFCRYASVCHDGQDFWLAPRTGNFIVKWDGRTNCRVFTNCAPKMCEKKNDGCLDIVFWQNHLILLPASTGNLWEIDRNTGEVQEIDVKYRNLHYAAQWKCDGNLYLSSHEGKWTILKEDIKHPSFKWIYAFSDKCLETQMGRVFYEDEREGLSGYLEAISVCQSQTIGGRCKPRIGNRIWESLKQSRGS